MDRQRRLASIGPAVLGLVVAALVWTGPASSQTPPAVADPHGTYGPASDTCKKCHAVHDAASPTGLLKENDPKVCYSCHDGSTQATDVQSAFGTLTAPRTSNHPVPGGTLTCADCHSAHKSPEQDTAQLRVMVNGSYLYSPPEALGTPIGNAFCYACHGTGSTLPAPNGDHQTFETGIHNTSADVPFPASGSKIKCLACHDPHGSNQPHLTTSGLRSEDLCYSCHSQATPNTSGGPAPIAPSNPFDAFNVVPNNDYAQDDTGANAGVRLFHHPMSNADQAGGARVVACASCHNSHLADQSDGADTSKIVNPANVNEKFIVSWTPGSYGQRGNINAFCATCHRSPTNTQPLTATMDGSIPYTVTMVNDTGPMYDDSSDPTRGTHAHDNFTYSYWLTSDLSHGPSQGDLACTACHDFHGSSNAFGLKETVISVGPDTIPGTTQTVTGWQAVASVAGDAAKIQSFCTTCHTGTHNAGQECTSCHYHGNTAAKW